jgi:hypothetical protein
MNLRPLVRRAVRPRFIAVIVVVAAGVVAYQLTIPVNQVVRTRLSRLVIAQTGLSGYKKPAASAQAIANASSPIAAVKAARKKNPNNTGSYAREWTSTASSYDLADVLAVWVPTAATAGTTLNQAASSYLGKTSYTTDTYTYQGPLGGSGVPGARGAYYQAKATKTMPATTLAVTIFRQGRVVVVVDTLALKSTQARNDNVSLARAQAGHLATVLPGFTLVRTTRPPLATALFAAGTVAVAVCSWFIFSLVARIRRRRQLRRAARARYEVQVRGQKIVKRHRTPTR